MDELRRSTNVNKIRAILSDLVETEEAPSHDDIQSCRELIQAYFLNRKPYTFVDGSKLK